MLASSKRRSVRYTVARPMRLSIADACLYMVLMLGWFVVLESMCAITRRCSVMRRPFSTQCFSIFEGIAADRTTRAIRDLRAEEKGTFRTACDGSLHDRPRP